MAQPAPAASSDEQLAVLHSLDTWLWLTMTWLYTQVSSLPDDVVSYAVSDKTDNLDKFPFERLTSADADRGLWRTASNISWKVAKFRRNRLLKRVVDEQRPSILHSHFGDRGWANLDFCARNRLAHVVSFYGYDASRLPVSDERWRSRFLDLFAQADLFLCEGPHLARTLVELGCPEEKARVHHLGVQVDNIPFRERKWDGNGPLRILLSGTFVEKKGLPYALESLGNIARRVQIEVTVIGDSNGQERSEKEKAKIVETIGKVGLSDKVRLMGYQPLDTLMQEAYRHHVFLSPSVTASDGDTEGGAPVTLIEMAASGMPIVSSWHCDIPNVIIDGDTGLLAKERDVADLTRCLEWMVDNRDKWQEMLERGRQRIENEFDSARLATGLASIYRSIN